jgi:hypothetical protein
MADVLPLYGLFFDSVTGVDDFAVPYYDMATGLMIAAPCDICCNVDSYVGLRTCCDEEAGTNLSGGIFIATSDLPASETILYKGLCWTYAIGPNKLANLRAFGGIWTDAPIIFASDFTSVADGCGSVSQCPSCSDTYLSTLPATLNATINWTGDTQPLDWDCGWRQFKGVNFSLVYTAADGRLPGGGPGWISANTTTQACPCGNFDTAYVFISCGMLADCTLTWHLQFRLQCCVIDFYSPPAGATSGGSNTPIGLTWTIDPANTCTITGESANVS